MPDVLGEALQRGDGVNPLDEAALLYLIAMGSGALIALVIECVGAYVKRKVSKERSGATAPQDEKKGQCA